MSIFLRLSVFLAQFILLQLNCAFKSAVMQYLKCNYIFTINSNLYMFVSIGTCLFLPTSCQFLPEKKIPSSLVIKQSISRNSHYCYHLSSDKSIIKGRLQHAPRMNGNEGEPCILKFSTSQIVKRINSRQSPNIRYAPLITNLPQSLCNYNIYVKFLSCNVFSRLLPPPAIFYIGIGFHMMVMVSTCKESMKDIVNLHNWRASQIDSFY